MTNGQQVSYYDKKMGFWVNCYIVSFTAETAIVGTRNGSGATKGETEHDQI